MCACVGRGEGRGGGGGGGGRGGSGEREGREEVVLGRGEKSYPGIVTFQCDCELHKKSVVTLNFSEQLKTAVSGVTDSTPCFG